MTERRETLLITGGAGFIGSALVRRAIGEGRRVVNLDKLTYAANLRNLERVENNPLYTFVKGDIADRPLLDRVLGDAKPDAVMHLAAETHVDRSIDGPADFIQTNIVGSYALMEAARDYWRGARGGDPEAFRFHHVSTDEVFGALGETGLFTEESPYAPNSPYAASKAASDMLARAWGRTFGLPVVISNCSNNYGPFQFPEKLIPTVIFNAIAGAPIPVYGRGENVRDWLHVDDHAEALLAIVDRGAPLETYNVGGDEEVRNIDLVRRLCAALDELRPKAGGGSYAEQIAFVEDRPGHDLRYAIDASKIAGTLGWRPRTAFADGLRATALWYLENDAWRQSIQDGGFDGRRLGLEGTSP